MTEKCVGEPIRIEEGKVSEFFEIRRSLEGWCASKAAKAGSKSQFAAIKARLDAMHVLDVTSDAWEENDIGFHTALVRAEDYINSQRSHLKSHETVGVFRIFGRNAGFTALGAAMAISDVRCLIPEHRFDLDALCAAVARDHAANSSRYALVLCSEGAMWAGDRKSVV